MDARYIMPRQRYGRVGGARAGGGTTRHAGERWCERLSETSGRGHGDGPFGAVRGCLAGLLFEFGGHVGYRDVGLAFVVEGEDLGADRPAAGVALAQIRVYRGLEHALFLPSEGGGVGRGEVVDSGRVADGDLVLDVLGEVSQPLAGEGRRLRPRRVGVRVVA